MTHFPTNLHFVLFPLMTQGHMIPMVDIARLLAERGSTITIVTTPVNANRFKPVITRAIEKTLKIQVLELELPSAEFGLPEGCENFDMIQSAELYPKLFAASCMLEQPAENLLRGLSPPPTCIVSDNLFPWTSELARKLNVPRVVFHGPGCFTFLCIHVVMSTDVVDRVESETEYFALPGIPDRVELTKPQASSWARKDVKETAEFFERVRKAEESADGIVVNSFRELEPYYVDELAKAKGKKVWCIGPVSLCNKDFLDIAERGNKGSGSGLSVMVTDEPKPDCLTWLDSRDPESVIFICSGSLARASTKQNIELGLGLESSNKPFLWCVKHASHELEQWFAEQGYEERVKDRGLIIRGWAPQVLILSHRAVGGFLTHCGWNSTLEGIAAGVSMVTWPHFADQFINERFIVDVLKIGVKIGVEVPVVVGEEDKYGVMVKKEEIKRVVEDVMDEGKEGEERRKRSRELGEMAKKAMEVEGSSYLGLTLMIQDIGDLLGKRSMAIQDCGVQEV